MWCVAELTEEYVRKMEDVLKLYEMPHNPAAGSHLWGRFTVHYTPKHGSWLNQAEIEIGLFARQCLGSRRLPSLALLEAEARAWNRQINDAQTKIHWRFTRKDARRNFGYNKHLSKRSQH